MKRSIWWKTQQKWITSSTTTHGTKAVVSYGCILHVRIKNDKVYIEYDGTDEGFGDVFVEAGIPKQDIVLAFHAPAKRPYTGFAVA